MSTTIGITEALLSLAPGAEWSMTNNKDYKTLNWISTDVTKPTENEVNAEIVRLQNAEPLTKCSDKAKLLLSDSDWSVLPDVNISNKAEFETYRAALRALVFNPVVDPVFPTEPQPVWV